MNEPASSIAVILNGESCTLPVGITVVQLIDRVGFTGKRIAVEVNGEIVARHQHPTWSLQQGDHIEIVKAIGGG
jgi:sulfur carrier protein